MILSHFGRQGLALLLLIFTMTSACESHTASMERNWEESCWSAADTLDLVFSNPDTQKVYMLEFPMVLTEDYNYNNIYLHAVVRSPSGDENMLPARFDLMNPAGTWLAESSGDKVSFELNIADGLRFNQLGNYTIRLFHYMRDERLCGVSSIGIALDELVSE